jgi:hypothetical protein
MIRRPTSPDENGRVWEISDIRTQTAREADAEYERRGFEVFWQQDDFGQPIAGIPAVPGIRITPESAMLCSVVCACVRVISETCAQLPLHLVRHLEGGGKQNETSNPIYRLLHTAPNKRHSSFFFRELMTSWCALYGNAYAEIVRVRGQITALVPLHPSRMSIERLENRELRFRYNEPTGGVTYYSEDQILHLSWMSSDGLVGMMPVGLARDAIQMARACEIHGIGFFANSARPSVVLETEHSIPPEAQERLREAWERVHRGPAQAGKTAILPNGLKAHELGQSNSDQQYLELRQFQIGEVARIWRVPPHLVGDLSRATFSNIESQGLDFLNYCMMPWIRRWESALSMALFSDQYELCAEFDVRGLMRADSATRAQYYSTMMNLGVYSLNECRDLETLPPVEGGDTRFVTLNVQTLEAALAAAKSGPAKPDAPGSEPPPAADQSKDGKNTDPLAGTPGSNQSQRSMDAGNCGTGKGGFHAGNKCAAGRDGEEAGEMIDDDETLERTEKLIDVLTNPENADGFTVDPVGFETPADGLMVSLNKEQNHFSTADIATGAVREQLGEWFDKYAAQLYGQKNKYVGGWLDAGDGTFYLDVATRFEPSQAKEVLEAARDAKQYAVFNLDTKRDTWVRYEQNDPRRPEDYDTQFAKWLASRGLTDKDYEYGRDSVRSIDDFLDDICRRARLFDALRRAGVAEKEIPALANRALERLKNVRSRKESGSRERADGNSDERAVRRGHREDGAGEARAEAVAEAPVGDNCGTGAGGFKPGNTCAKGGDGGGSSATSDAEAEPKKENADGPSAENCPAPCEMLAPVEDGGTLDVSVATDSESTQAFNWDAATEIGGGEEEAIVAYTGEEYEAMNSHLRDGGDLGDYSNGSIDPFNGMSADEILEKYGDDEDTLISGMSALDNIRKLGPMIDDFKEVEENAQELYDRVTDRMTVEAFDKAGLAAYFAPNMTYANKADASKSNVTLLPDASDEEIEELNNYSKEILNYQLETSAGTSEALKEAVDQIVADNSSSASSYDPNASYELYDTALERAQSDYFESDDYKQHTSDLQDVENGIKSIAESANPEGKNFVTWRTVGGNSYGRELSEKAKVGDTLGESGFLSTSASPSAALAWKGSATKVLFRVIGRSGAPVDRISANRGEHEVLYPHEATFTITNVAHNVDVTVGKNVDAGGVTVIDVLED